MSFTIGTRLGPYEITTPLGSGGMGTVYRARDTRLGRDVALKVLSGNAVDDPERLRRFQQEATATGLLNHPNLLAIYDVGTHDGAPYLVSELLEGQTLRERLDSTSLPARKAIDYATQIAHGLAAAHDKAIVHRDLKPENLFVTNDGRIKILDFGLAKLGPQIPGSLDRQAPTITLDSSTTGPGVVLGTVGYMAPEQVRGEPADHRADLFALGAILYEMLSGRRAFRRASAIETLNAILKEDPPDLSEASALVPPALDRVVRRCLEKSPDERFQSARDLGFALEALSGLSGSMESSPLAPPVRHRGILPVLACCGVVIALCAASFWAGEWLAQVPLPAYHRQTFHQGVGLAARFAPDGKTILYTGSYGGNPPEVFLTSPDTPESRSLDLPRAGILSVSRTGEMAIALGLHLVKPFVFSGTLAQVQLGGGAPRQLLEDVQAADWAPDGKGLTVVREHGAKNRLEYPIGKVLYETNGWISDPRFSPSGNRIALVDHPLQGVPWGSLVVVDLAGKARTLVPDRANLWGAAWSPRGNEVWFTAADATSGRALFAVSLAGRERLVDRIPGALKLFDISSDGHVLVARESGKSGINAHFPGSDTERDLSWFDLSLASDLSSDGKTLLITERGEGGGERSLVYLRDTSGSPAVRLGAGVGTALSRDGRSAISIQTTLPARVTILPTGPGQEEELKTAPIISCQTAQWFPDGQRVALIGTEPGHGTRLYILSLDGSAPRSISEDGFGPYCAISPDGKQIATTGPMRTGWLFTVSSEPAKPRQIPGFLPGETPIRWGVDGASLYVYRLGELPAHVYRLDVKTGQREHFKQLMPAEPSGVVAIGPVQVTPDGKSYAYTYHRVEAELYLVLGLK